MITYLDSGEESQQIVGQAYSSNLQYPVYKLSRLQKICGSDNSKLQFELMESGITPYPKCPFANSTIKAYLFSFITTNTLHIQHGF